MLKGNRCRTKQRVPCSAAGYRVGASAIRSTAVATSWANAAALKGLRSIYQARASRSSARADGWNLTLVPAPKEFLAYFLPRDGLDGSGFDLGYSSRDFF